MRKNIDSMLGFSIMAIDGELGKVRDFYFDDENWTIRYMVVQTGSWLLGRKVLISFTSVKKVDFELSMFMVDLSCEQVRNSPDIDTEKPVCRQHEMELHEHYMLSPYWINSSESVLGMSSYPFTDGEVFEDEEDREEKPAASGEDQHLRSAKQVMGYLIHAVDGEIGHVKDFIVEINNWLITFFLVDTRNLLSGRKILLSTEKIERIEWADSEVYVSISRGDIINSPEFKLDKDL